MEKFTWVLKLAKMKIKLRPPGKIRKLYTLGPEDNNDFIQGSGQEWSVIVNYSRLIPNYTTIVLFDKFYQLQCNDDKNSYIFEYERFGQTGVKISTIPREAYVPSQLLPICNGDKTVVYLISCNGDHLSTWISRDSLTTFEFVSKHTAGALRSPAACVTPAGYLLLYSLKSVSLPWQISTDGGII